MEGEPTNMRIIREGFIQRLFGLDFRERCQIVVHNRNKDTGRKIEWGSLRQGVEFILWQ